MQSELNLFAYRPKTLVSDLVLRPLATDVFESGAAVRHTAESTLPHKAYANARLAFEGAQQALILATHENYLASGSRAWVYFESKDANWRASLERKRSRDVTGLSAEKWLEERVARMSKRWDSIAPGQGNLLTSALLQLRQNSKRKPDNWLHENLTERHHQASELFAAENGRGSPADTMELNQKMYVALCREAHARKGLTLAASRTIAKTGASMCKRKREI